MAKMGKQKSCTFCLARGLIAVASRSSCESLSHADAHSLDLEEHGLQADDKDNNQPCDSMELEMLENGAGGGPVLFDTLIMGPMAHQPWSYTAQRMSQQGTGAAAQTSHA